MYRSIFVLLSAIVCSGAALAQDAAPPSETAAPAQPAKADDLMGYKGGFYLHVPGGKFAVKINSRVQARYEFASVDAPDETSTETRFSIPRARLKLSGHAFSPAITYGFQTDFGKGAASLKDFYVDFAIVKGVFHLRVGQWKKPFSRQQLTSSGKQELVDRAITDKAFGAGRDIGLAFHNRLTKSPRFAWAVGLFNGSGDTASFHSKLTVDPTTGHVEDVTGKFSNVPTKFHPLVVARIGFNTPKLKGFSEADLEGGGLRAGVGLGGIVDLDADNTNDGNVRGNLDFILKAHGFSTTGALYVASSQDGLHFRDQAFSAWGAHVQAGYVVRDLLQPVVRYAVVDPDDGPAQHEIRGGLSLYLYGHHVKWQTDAGALLSGTGAAREKEFQLRSQLQFAF